MAVHITIIVPVYNEEEAIPLFHSAIKNNKELSACKIELIFVNDGSTDNTAHVIRALKENDPSIVLINLSRNFGKEAALFAGIDHAKGDATVLIDVDLQDPIDLIPEMIQKWKNGADVVLAQRTDRSDEPYFKYVTASLFYKIYNMMAKVKIPYNVGDFRLMDKKVIEAIRTMPERKLFMKGVLNWVGFNQEIIEYKRDKRAAGNSKFNALKLWGLALDGIFSFSTIPLRIWTYMGFIISLLSLLYAVYLIMLKLFWGIDLPGYPSLMTAILFLGGVQLIGIGVLGEYIGRTYHEVKRRPKYIIKEIL